MSPLLAPLLTAAVFVAPAPPAPVGDGAADDTAALQALVDAGTGDIRLPRGTYRLTAPVTVDLSEVGFTSVSGGGGVARLVMAGPGPALKFVGSHDGTAAPDSVADRVWDRERFPTVDGLEILGAHPDADGVAADGTMKLTLTRLLVRECRHAVRLIGRNRNVTLADCHLYHNRGAGVFLDGVNLHQIGLTNCHVSYNAGGGVVALGSEVRNLQIGSCDIEGNTAGPAPDGGPAANVLLDSTDRSVAEVAIVGCTIQHDHDHAGSANVRVRGRAEPLKYADERREGHVLIADNVFSDVRVNVELTNVRGAAVTGNTFWHGYDANLTLDGCSRVVVGNNVFDRNPRYHYGDGADAQLGVRLTDCDDVVYSGNLSGGPVGGEAAVVFRRCRRLNVSGCSVLDYGGRGAAGLLLDGVTDSLFTGNLVRDDRGEDAGPPLVTREVTGVTFAGNAAGGAVAE